MEYFFSLFQYDFMQRALVVGVFLAFLYAILGIFTVVKKMAFFTDGIAHASLFGVALGIALGQGSFFYTLVFAIIFGLTVYYIERSVKIGNDVIISLLFTSGLSAGIIVLSLTPGYKSDIIGYLFGNILIITKADFYITLIISLMFGSLILIIKDKLTLVFFDPVEAKIRGVSEEKYNLFFYLILSISIILGVKMLGIVLISALLIIPTFIGLLLSRNFKSLFIITVIVAELMVFLGLIISYHLNIPTGPTIALFGIFLISVLLLTKKLLKIGTE